MQNYLLWSHFDCDHKEKQHIQKNGSKTIEELCMRGEILLENNLLRAAWHQDVVERLYFEKDQQNCSEFLSVYSRNWSEI